MLAASRQVPWPGFREAPQMSSARSSLRTAQSGVDVTRGSNVKSAVSEFETVAAGA